MTELDVDTLLIDDSIKKIERNILDYNSYIQEFFSLISKVNTDLSVWNGNVAKNYVDSVTSKEEIYLSFGEQMMKFLELFYDANDDLKKVINKSIIDGDEE